MTVDPFAIWGWSLKRISYWGQFGDGSGDKIFKRFRLYKEKIHNFKEKLPQRNKISSYFPGTTQQCYPCHFDRCRTHHLCLEDAVCLSVKCVPLGACMRVTEVKCWCLVNCIASLECIYKHTHTHRFWPAVKKMFPCLLWSDPKDYNTTAASIVFFTLSQRTPASLRLALSHFLCFGVHLVSVQV